jgi:hypothetical protein
MSRRLLAGSYSLAAVLALSAGQLLAPAPARANCGSESVCPIDQPATHADTRFLFDVSQLYIDQDQPRVGTDDAFVGAIAGHHDEVRTVNRVTNFRLTFRTAPGWTFGANLPYIHRTHEHIHHHMGEDHYERWNYDGLGDVELSASRLVGAGSGPRFRVGLGVKAPTGKQTPALSEGGDELEPSARIGSGSWDLLASLGAEWNLRAPGQGAEARMPVRATVTGRYNGSGAEDFRHGAETQVHLGADYPLARRLVLLVQTNYRLRAKNDVGDADDEETANSGSAVVYVTPGLRFDAIEGFSIYGLAQVPVYERVNGIQVVARSNLVLGISRSIF